MLRFFSRLFFVRVDSSFTEYFEYVCGSVYFPTSSPNDDFRSVRCINRCSETPFIRVPPGRDRKSASLSERKKYNAFTLLGNGQTVKRTDFLILPVSLCGNLCLLTDAYTNRLFAANATAKLLFFLLAAIKIPFVSRGGWRRVVKNNPRRHRLRISVYCECKCVREALGGQRGRRVFCGGAEKTGKFNIAYGTTGETRPLCLPVFVVITRVLFDSKYQ